MSDKECIVTKNVWSIACIVAAVVMAAIGFVSAYMGGCDTMVELANGNSAPMKCFWTFVADTYVAVGGIAIALMAMTCKDQSGRRAMAVAYIVVAIVVACLPAPFAIGLCAMPDMHCHGTATIVWALSAVAAVIGIVQIVKSKPVAAKLPKRSL